MSQINSVPEMEVPAAVVNGAPFATGLTRPADSSIVAASLEREVGRGIVGICKQRTGRGPTTARTHYSEDLLTVVLADMLTQVEQTLLEGQRSDLVRETRDRLGAAIHEEAVALVESKTGRTVLASMSGHSVVPDYAVYSFVLGNEIEA